MPKTIQRWSAERVIYYIAEDTLNRKPRATMAHQLQHGFMNNETRKIILFASSTVLLFALDFVLSMF